MLGRRCRAALQGVSTLRLGRVDTARRRWSRPLCGSASIRTSDPKSRRVEVTGTTWTTDGAPSSSRCAVTTTAGCRYPASRPTGVPRSTVTTSPEVSIEPGGVCCVRVGAQVLGDLVLARRFNSRCVAGQRVRHARLPSGARLTPAGWATSSSDLAERQFQARAEPPGTRRRQGRPTTQRTVRCLLDAWGAGARAGLAGPGHGRPQGRAGLWCWLSMASAVRGPRPGHCGTSPPATSPGARPPRTRWATRHGPRPRRCPRCHACPGCSRVGSRPRRCAPWRGSGPTSSPTSPRSPGRQPRRSATCVGRRRPPSSRTCRPWWARWSSRTARPPRQGS